MIAGAAGESARATNQNWATFKTRVGVRGWIVCTGSVKLFAATDPS
jgi:hypothetical protein